MYSLEFVSQAERFLKKLEKKEQPKNWKTACWKIIRAVEFKDWRLQGNLSNKA